MSIRKWYEDGEHVMTLRRRLSDDVTTETNSERHSNAGSKTNATNNQREPHLDTNKRHRAAQRTTQMWSESCPPFYGRRCKKPVKRGTGSLRKREPVQKFSSPPGANPQQHRVEAAERLRTEISPSPWRMFSFGLKKINRVDGQASDGTGAKRGGAKRVRAFPRNSFFFFRPLRFCCDLAAHSFDFRSGILRW